MPMCDVIVFYFEQPSNREGDHGDFIFIFLDGDLSELEVMLIVMLGRFSRCKDPVGVKLGSPGLGNMFVAEADKVGFVGKDAQHFSGISHLQPYFVMEWVIRSPGL